MQMKHIFLEVPGSADRSLDETGQWKNTGRKERTVPVGISSVSRNDKTRYAYDLEKETDSVMRTDTGKPYLRLHPELFSISAIRENGSPVRWEMSLWGLIFSITEK